MQFKNIKRGKIRPAVAIYGGAFFEKCFTGKELDAETGLYYYGARYLDPRISRWLSVDPAMYEGDYLPSAPVSDEARQRNQNLPGIGGIYNYVNFHVYHYGGNNPVKYIDPDGRHVHIRITAEAIGTGILRNGPVGSNKTRIVPTFLMTVTDDITGTVSEYRVTRHGVFEQGTERSLYNKFFTFEPREDSKTFIGRIGQSTIGAGTVIRLFELDGETRGDLFRRGRTTFENNFRNIFNRELYFETNDRFLQIHIGGLYYNIIEKKVVLATSAGCFSLNGINAGVNWRDKFINDIRNRLSLQNNETGNNIYVTVDRLD